MDGKCKAAATGSDVSNAQDAVATDSDGEDGAGSDARNDDLADAGEDTAPGEVVGQDATGCVPKCPSDDCKDGCGGICEGTCEDGNLCTAGDHCEAGACKPASTKLCNDGNDCTYDGCAPAMGCVFTALEGAACPDGNPCTYDGTCSGQSCKPGTPINCDDKNPCTKDLCEGTAGGCEHIPVDGPCGSGGKCVAGKCQTCPPGKVLSVSNQCVSAVGCEGKCGDKSVDGSGKGCYCDEICSDPKYNDCCADKQQWCGDGACKPKDKKVCCGKDLCWLDSCGKQDPAPAEKCKFGCDEAAKACATDLCKGVPIEGVCLGSQNAYTFCSVPTGNQQPSVEVEFCAFFEECKMVDGAAQCVELPGFCEPGEMQCDPKNPDQARVCDDQGAWKNQPCPSCKYTAIGPACPGKIATVPYKGTFSYEYQAPNDFNTDWTTVPQTFQPIGAIAVSLHAEPGGPLQMIDADYVPKGGTVTLEVAKTPGAQDSIALGALAADWGTSKLRLAVVIPDTADGKQEVEGMKPGKPWWWSWPVSTLAPSYSVTVPANQSAALNVYYAVQWAMDATADQYFKYGDPLIVWLRMNTTWSCGACVWPSPIDAFGTTFQQQMFIGADAVNQAYWSDAVNAHEAGHWVMDSYGKSPGEGGTHFLGNPTFPGQAWSEGWATYFSSLLRDDAVYFDKQNGGAFWFDISKMQYSKGQVWQKPSAMGGLLQKMDENHVAAMLWAMTSKATEDPISEPDNKRFFAALASPAMTKPWIVQFSQSGYAATGYGRGYFRHSWDVAPDGTFFDVSESKQPAPMVADMFDALMCLKAPDKPLPGWQVKLAIGNYPFPSDAPKCKP
jgi:hypothetical protein